MLKNISLLLLILVCCGCSEDFKTAAPHKDITIVTGVLRMEDTAHYIAVRKAFQNEEQDALLSAQSPDSTMYRNLTVTFIESADGKNINSETPLTLVDLNAEGYPKEEGVFAAAPNYVYKFKLKLNPDSYYRLVIHNNETGRRDSSKLIQVVDGKYSLKRHPGYDIIHFADTGKKEGVLEVSGVVPKNAVFMQGGMTVRYTDSNTATGQTSKHTFSFPFGDTVGREGNYFTVRIGHYTILTNIAGSVGTAPANTVRLLGSCAVWYMAGNKDLSDYQQIRFATNQFITADMIKPLYTNMLTENTLGVLGSVTCSGNDSAIVDGLTLQKLINDPLTKKLNFVGRSGD